MADVVRTDYHRQRPLLGDTPATTALRQRVRARRDLVAHRVAVANQPRAHPRICFPGGVGLVHDLDSEISLRFLERFPHQECADWLSVKRLNVWLVSVGYRARVDPDAVSSTAITAAFVAVLRALTTQIAGLAERISEQLELHPDQEIFTSLPRSRRVRAARMLAEIGDARGRFPTADSAASRAGVAPSTRQSGQIKTVSFRWAADRQLHDAICDSDKANPGAADLYRRARARGHDHPHAVRVLARAWVTIIWACWTTHSPYDRDRPNALQHILNQGQRPAA